MGKPSSKGFSRNVYTQPHHNNESIFEAGIEDIDKAKKELKAFLLSIVEISFRRYAKCHGAKEEQEELEWQRFQKILKGML